MIPKVILIHLLLCPFYLLAQVPATLSIDGEKLLKNKSMVDRGDSIYVRAVDKLIFEADILLSQGPYSVTFKGGAIGDASLRDYVSLATYYWPDPSKPDGLPYIHKDGEVFKGRERIPDYKMMNTMADNVLVLGMAYFYTCDEKYVLHAKYLLEFFFFDSKTGMNPNFEFSQVILGREGSGGATISATSLISVIEGVQLISASNYWKDKDHKRLQAWFSEFLEWMLYSEKGKREAASPNNVGTYYTLQTAVYAMFTDQIELCENIIKVQAFNRIDCQIGEDGQMLYELNRATPWNYVSYNLAAFGKLVEVAKKVGVDLLKYQNGQGGGIEAAFEWVLSYRMGITKWEYSNEPISFFSIDQTLSRINGLAVKDFKNISYKNHSEYYRFLLF